MIQNIEDWGQEVQDNTGIAPNVVVMTTDAWALLKTDPNFKNLIDTKLRELAPAAIETGPTVKPRAGPRKVGTMGDYTLYTYSGSYTDPEDGQVKKILAAGHRPGRLDRRRRRAPLRRDPRRRRRHSGSPVLREVLGCSRSQPPLPAHAVGSAAGPVPPERGTGGDGTLSPCGSPLGIAF
jgi:hypothetical protein